MKNQNNKQNSAVKIKKPNLPLNHTLPSYKKSLHALGSVTELVDALLACGCGRGVSDIHIDPTSTCIRIRFRSDGVLNEIDTLSATIHEELIARIKTLAGLRADVHFVPQDGRFAFTQDDKAIDVRVSILPTHYGESAVLRLLWGKDEEPVLADLGFSKTDEARIRTALDCRQGLILVTGPTGSGKTSTLYALLRMLATGKKSIITVEDPVEYALQGVRQIQIRERHGVTFVNGLRSIIRQDPDVIMVSELRDSETAKLATNVSLAGHLLLSALPTNSALGAIPRLMDIGIDPYLVGSTVSLIIAQRLVRKVCRDCRGVGCEKCSQSGYKGRTVIGETLVVDEKLRVLITARTLFQEITRHARAAGLTTMYEDGMDKAQRGITTKEEVLRVLHE
jgi:type IV pilus assembly protein PilB